jgi:aspartyl protease family protein
MLAESLKITLGAAVVALFAASLISHGTNALAPPPPNRAAAAAGSFYGAENVRQGSAHGYGRIKLTPDGFGQYHADVEIDGRRLPMLIDTGASFVALTYDDAASVGIRPMPSDFNVKMSTANGISLAAAVRLREVRLDTIDVSDIPAIVMPRNVSATSLLGMSFLKKLGGFQVADGDLVLKP